jgi:hypothetical protein
LDIYAFFAAAILLRIYLGTSYLGQKITVL